MEMRYPVHQNQVERMTTEELRTNFLISDIFQAGKLCLVYSHIDRVIVGGAVPVDTPRPVRRLLQRCLHRDRRHRLQAIGVQLLGAHRFGFHLVHYCRAGPGEV